MNIEEPKPGPDTGGVIVGIFFLLFGICILLVGGGCTIFWIAMVGSESANYGDLGLLLVSILVAAGGLWSIIFAIRIFRGPAVTARQPEERPLE
jgi:hypothetical protein